MTEATAAGHQHRFTLTTAEGRALALLHALPGAVAGLAAWLSLDVLGGVSERWPAFVVPLALFGVGAWALATEPGRRGRALVFAAALGLALGGLSWSAHGRYDEGGYVQGLLLLPLLGWVALSFYRAGPRDYPKLFADAWNLPVVLAVALAFTGGAYGLLWLLAAMFDLIGLPMLSEALGEGIVSFPVLGALAACGIAVVRRQESILLSLRTVLFGLLRVLAPVFALGTALFAVALLFQGLNTLWDGWSPVALLTATLAAGVVFVNAVVQDEAAPGGVLGWGARLQALVLPVLGALAAYGMIVRIGEHGLTPQRILACLVAGFACAYALAYAVAALLGRWSLLRRANVVLALALAGVATATLTPAFRAQAWSVADQLRRLETGAVAAEDFDYAALRFEMGKPGREALRALAEGDGPVAERAVDALAASSRYEAVAIHAADGGAIDAYLARALVRPRGADLPEGFEREVRERIYPGDADGEEDTVFLVMPGYEAGRGAVLWVRRRGRAARIEAQLYLEAREDAPLGARAWAFAESFPRRFESEAAADAFMANARDASFGPVPVTILVPAVAGVPLLPEDGRARLEAPDATAPSPR